MASGAGSTKGAGSGASKLARQTVRWFWKVIGERARDGFKRAVRGVLTPVLSLRYHRWRAARSAGRLIRWLRSDWRPLLIGIAALIGALIAGSRIRIGGHSAQAAVAASPGHPAVAAHPAVAGHALATAPQVLVVFALLGFLRLAWESRQRTVFQDIIDGTGTYKGGVVPGLSAMLAAEVSRLANLYRSLDAQLNFSRDHLSLQDPLRATLQVDDTAQFLQSAVSASSTISLGPITVPVGAILSLVARLMKGPRVGGNLQWDGEQLLLVVRYDGKPPRVWKVVADVPASHEAAAGDKSADPLLAAAIPLGVMVEDLACRIFTDLALRGTVRCQAAAAFTKAMQIYVEEGRRGRGDPARLQEVARSLLEAVAADEDFDLAWYNLGVVYGEMGKTEAARRTLVQARSRNPDRWDVTYALALPGQATAASSGAADPSRDLSRLAVPEAERLPRRLLCDEVLRSRPGPGAEAQALDLRAFLEAPNDEQQAQGEALAETARGLLLQAGTVARSPLGQAAAGDAVVSGALAKLAGAVDSQDLSATTAALIALQPALDTAATRLAPADADRCRALGRRAEALSIDCGRTDSLLKENRQSQVRALAEAGHSQRRAVRLAWKALRRAERATGPSDFGEDSDDVPALRRHRVLASTCLVHLAVTFLDSTELENQAGIRDRGRRRRAEVLLHQAVRLDPPDPEAHYRLGRVFARGRRTAKKLADLELRKAVALRPIEARYWARLLDLRVDSHDGPAARAALAAYLPLSPPPLQHPETHTGHRRIVVDRLLADEEVWTTTSGMPWLSNEEVVRLDVAQRQQLAATRRHELAERLRAMPLVAEWLRALAKRAGDGEAAAWAELWKQLTDAKTHDEWGWEHAAAAWALKAAYDDYIAHHPPGPGDELEVVARELAEAVDHLHRTNPEVCRREGLRGDYAQWLTVCGRPEEAIFQAERALQADPFSPFELTVVGDAYMAMQEYVLAERAYQRAGQWVNDPAEVGRIAWARASCLINQADDRRDYASRDDTLCSAIRQLDQALDLLDDQETDERILTHYWLGRLHSERRAFDDAIPHLRTASRYRSRGKNPVDRASAQVTALLALADARAANRLHEDAAATYRQVERVVRELVKHRSDLARTVGGELEHERSLGHVLVLSLAGQAEHLARRRADLPSAATLLRRSRRIGRVLDGDDRRRVHARLDAIAGLIASAAGNIAEAERHLQQAIDLADDAQVYLDLAELWVRQIDETDSRHQRDLAHRINDLIRHVDQIDRREEWAASLVPFRSVVERVLNS